MGIVKRALVFYLYSQRNAGDMALCIGAVNLLKQAGFETVFVSRYARQDHEYRDSVDYLRRYYPEVTVFSGPFSLDRQKGPFSRLIAHTRGLLTLFSPSSRRRLKGLIEEADLVLFNGGNLLRCQNMTDVARLIALFHPIALAKSKGKQTVCLPQSTADSSRAGQIILANKLSNCDVVYSRESRSHNALSLHYPGIDIRPSTDLAFFIDKNLIATRKLDEKTQMERHGLNSAEATSSISGRVAIVIRGSGIGDIGSLGEARVNSFIEGLRTFVRVRSNYRYAIVVQTEKDVELSREFFHAVAEVADAVWVEEHDPVALLSLYSDAKALVTMRLHAGILATVAGIPVVGLFDESWGLKNSGIMDDYELEYTHIPEELPARFDRALDSFSPKRSLETIDAERDRLVTDLREITSAPIGYRS
ncbi:MAG: polysaccharide pyruvyl transferase family protein [Ancrocorticia sp.]|uniref:polysaccharide pyruvyl transferase family protein n=2 Tax=Ancrocorticia sp. TaxID=2593684 RepID=UPI003F91276F